MKSYISIESIKMSLSNIFANKVRSILTSLGVFIGVAAVIVLVGFGSGMKQIVSDVLQSFGSNLIIVYSGERMGSALVRMRTTNIIPKLTDNDLEYIKTLIPGLINYAAPETPQSGQVKYKNNNISSTIIGTSPEFQFIRDFQTTSGRFFSEADFIKRQKVAVLGYDAFSDLFPEKNNPTGEKIRINGISFTVVGVIEKKGNVLDSQIVIPISTFKRYINGIDQYTQINLQVKNFEDMKKTQMIIEQGLLKLHKATNLNLADFYVANQVDLAASTQETQETFTIFLGGIAIISLIVGGIGIMNIMLVSVTERTKEIGLRMAIGAKGRDILSQFIVESVILSMGGGILGVCAALLFIWIMKDHVGMAVLISWESILLAFGFSVFTGLFFGSYPAFRASKLDPIQALRSE